MKNTLAAKLKELNNKRVMMFSVGFVSALGLVGAFSFLLSDSSAAWWNENWAYRQRVVVTKTSAGQTDVYISFDSGDALDTSDSSKFQGDCGDIRFTKQNGEELPYYINSGCGTSSTDIDVLYDSLPLGENVLYLYYGNSSANNAGAASTFSTEATNYTIGTPGSEEIGPGPIAYWRFDEGQGTTAYDQRGINNGTLGYTVGGGGPVAIDSFSGGASIGRQLVRTSTGNLYTLFYGSDCEMWKSSDNGLNWTQQDAGTSLSCSVSGSEAIAIDSNDDIHVVYKNADFITLTYRLFDTGTDSWGSAENVHTVTGTGSKNMNHAVITVDTNDVPHVSFSTTRFNVPTAYYGIYYSNRVGGSWGGTVTIEGEVANVVREIPNITIDSDNRPQVAYTNSGALTVARGNVNDASTFASNKTVVDASIGAGFNVGSNSIVIDANNDTWVAYVDSDSDITLAYHDYSDSWSTWSTITTKTDNGHEPMAVPYGSQMYVFYQDDSTDQQIVYDIYNGSSWEGEVILHTPGGGTDNANVRPIWSYLNNTDYGSYGIDYVYNGPTTAYWANLGFDSGDAPSWEKTDLCMDSGCLRFDGDSNTVSINNSGSLDFDQGLNDAVSMAFWVRPMSDGENNTGEIFEKGSHMYCRTDTEGSGLVDLECSIDLATTDGTVNVTDGLTIGKWHHVVATYADDGDDDLLVYIDGELAGTGNGSGSPIGSDSSTLLIGGDASNNYHGFIDEFKVYPYARSADQVKLDYNNGAGLVLGARNQKNLSDGLVGYWPMDETNSGTCSVSGDDACDLSGNDNDGTWTSVTNTTGKFGGGIQNDADGYTQLLTDENISPDAGNLTIAAWFNTSTSYPSGADSAGFIFHDYGSVSQHSYSLGVGTDDKLWCLFRDGDGDEVEIINIGPDVNDGEWHHVICVRDNTEIRVYLDGELMGSDENDALGAIDTSDGTNLPRIGAFSASNDENFIGILDELRIYKRAFNQNDVHQLYNWAPGPYAYLPFDENSGTNIPDLSGNDYSGTWNGTGSHWVKGKFGNAAQFNGSDDFVSFSSLPKPANMPVTISFWAKPTSSTPVGIFDSAPSSVDVLRNYNTGYVEWWNQDPQVQLNLTANEWQHVSVVFDFDGANQTIDYYRDGVFITSVSSPDDGQFAWTTFRLGNINGGSAGWYSGLLDEFKIYDYARTPTQVIEDMNAGHPVGGSPISSKLSHWSYDEMSGDTLYDNGVGTNNGDLGGSGTTCPQSGESACPTYTNSGKANGALFFDTDASTDDYVDLGSDASLDNLPNNDFTVSIWIKPVDWNKPSGSQQSMFVTKGTNGSNAWSLYNQYNGKPVFIINLSTTDAIARGSDRLPLNTWSHILGTWDSSTKTARLYVNGVEVNYAGTNGYFEVGSGSYSSDAANSMYIGRSGSGSSNSYYHGYVDETKIYTTILTSEQIAIDMNAGSSATFGGVLDNHEADQLIDGNHLDNLIGYWPMDEKSGTTSTADKSGSGNDAAMNGSMTEDDWVKGRYGSGLDFDGNNDYLNVSNSPLPIYNEPSFTIMFWTNVPAIGGDRRIYAEGSSIDNDPVYAIGTASSGDPGRLRLFVRDDSGTSLIGVHSTNPIFDGNWHHIALVDTNGDVQLYVDGKYEQDMDYTKGTLTLDRAAIGALLRSGAGSFFQGVLDELKIFDISLTAAQVAYEYNRGFPVGHWKFDECQGSTTYDASGNGNDGTITEGGSGTNNGGVGTCDSGAGDEMWDNGTDGYFNANLHFDGTDDYVTSTSLPVTDYPMTITAWVNLETNVSNNTIFSIGDASSSGDYIQLYAPSGGTIRLRVVNGGTSDLTGTINIENDGWHFVTAVLGSATDRSIYIDTVFDGTETTSKNFPDNTDTWSIGRRVHSTPDHYFNGLIDDVRVYNYALSENQIKTVMNDGAVNFR